MAHGIGGHYRISRTAADKPNYFEASPYYRNNDRHQISDPRAWPYFPLWGKLAAMARAGGKRRFRGNHLADGVERNQERRLEDGTARPR